MALPFGSGTRYRRGMFSMIERGHLADSRALIKIKFCLKFIEIFHRDILVQKHEKSAFSVDFFLEKQNTGEKTFVTKK